MVREPPVSGDPVGAAKRARCERAGALRLLGDDSSAAGDAAAAAAARPVSATIAAAPRRGSESAIALRFILTVVRELDVETSAATELACCGFAAGSHITHVQNCANLA